MRIERLVIWVLKGIHYHRHWKHAVDWVLVAFLSGILEVVLCMFIDDELVFAASPMKAVFSHFLLA